MMQGFPKKLSEDGGRTVDALRATIARMDRTLPRRAGGTVLGFGIAAIDRHLPGGGLGPGLHEMAGLRDGGFAAVPARLAAHLFGRAGGHAPVLWVTSRRDIFAPGLAAAGLPPGRLLVAEAKRDVLAVMEEGARCPALGGVVGEIPDALTLTASRRLLLASEASGMPVLAIRRPRRTDPGMPAPVDAPNAAITRWRIAALPSRPEDPVEAGPFTLTFGPALWRLDLVRARGASPSSWIVEAFDETGRLAVPAPSRDRPAATPARRSRVDDERRSRVDDAWRGGTSGDRAA